MESDPAMDQKNLPTFAAERRTVRLRCLDNYKPMNAVDTVIDWNRPTQTDAGNIESTENAWSENARLEN